MFLLGDEPSSSDEAVSPKGVSQPTGQLTMADHYSVTKHLKDLSNEELMDLGGALGLHYSSLRSMSQPLLNEMVAAWLNGKDNVLSSTYSDRSWSSLSQALQDINQPGIAQKIVEGNGS